jgi:ABC-type phosphate/phosphonate transport system substrate-binding protein
MFDGMPSTPKEKRDRFQKGLFSMKWENPRHRRVLELEGLKMWMPPREEGYASLHDALDHDEK